MKNHPQSEGSLTYTCILCFWAHLITIRATQETKIGLSHFACFDKCIHWARVSVKLFYFVYTYIIVKTIACIICMWCIKAISGNASTIAKVPYRIVITVVAGVSCRKGNSIARNTISKPLCFIISKMLVVR